jgi:hypothetical protein
MKFNNNKMMKVRLILERLDDHGLKVMHVINAIKTFVLPRLDF